MNLAINTTKGGPILRLAIILIFRFIKQKTRNLSILFPNRVWDAFTNEIHTMIMGIFVMTTANSCAVQYVFACCKIRNKWNLILRNRCKQRKNKNRHYANTYNAFKADLKEAKSIWIYEHFRHQIMNKQWQITLGGNLCFINSSKIGPWFCKACSHPKISQE